MTRYYRLTKIFSCLRILFYSIMPVLQSNKNKPSTRVSEQRTFLLPDVQALARIDQAVD